MKIENGVHAITNEQYHSSDAISRSDLMRFKRSPMHFKNKPEHKDTPSLIIGNLVHTLVLEPHVFNDRYIVNRGFDRRSNEGKADYAEFMLASEGKIIVESKYYNEASKIADSVNNHMFKQYLCQGYNVENSIFFRHEASGLQCKVRPDAWLGDVVIDLKTSADASFRAFQSSAINYGYFLQAGMIKRALQSINKTLRKFIFVVVEKEYPYAVAIYDLDAEAIDYGANEFDNLMLKLKQNIETNQFPDYGIQTLTLPSWAREQL